MSRIATGNEVRRVPTSDVYTALVLIGILAELIAFVVLFLRMTEVFGPTGGLFS